MSSNVPLAPWAQVGPATFFPTGATFAPDMSQDDWRGMWPKFRNLHSACSWAIADWMIYGLENYGEQYAYGVVETGKQGGYLRNLVWVGRQFPPSRRRDSLTFSHHQEVAALPPAEQDEMLDKAEHEGWNTSDMRQEVRQINSDPAQKDEKGKAVTDFIPSSWVNEGLRYFNRQDVAQWPDERKAALKRELRPVVDIWEVL